jgi:hypothetical protein
MDASSLVPMYMTSTSAIRGKFIYGPLHSEDDHDYEFYIDGDLTELYVGREPNPTYIMVLCNR